MGKDEVIVLVEQLAKDDVKVSENAVDIKQYPPRTRQAAICVLMSIATFLSVLDTNLIVVALPSITNDLKSLQDVGWYSSA